MDDDEYSSEKNYINYYEEYLKYGNIRNDNFSILEYNEPSLIKELIRMKINELKKKNNKTKNNNMDKRENIIKIRNIKLNHIHDIKINKIKNNLINKKNLNSKIISKYYETNYKFPIKLYKKHKNRCLSMNNIYYEQHKNSYVEMISFKKLNNNLNLIEKGKKQKSFEIKNTNEEFGNSFTLKNNCKNIKSLSLIIEKFPHEKEDIDNLVFSLLNAEKSTSNYLYNNIGNYISKINQKINCLNELSILLELWKNSKISYIIQKRVLDYILSKKSSNIIEIINKEISGLEKYNTILLKNNILKHMEYFEEIFFRKNNLDNQDFSSIKNVILEIKYKEGIDVIWKGLKFEWFFKN